MTDQDSATTLAEQVSDAAARTAALRIRAGGSKDFLGRSPQGEVLDVTGHCGIVHYEPTELVITARAATPLAEIEAALYEHGQMLGFEPPHFAANATLGGTIACGLSGPARPFRGAARDYVLGSKMINGRGEILRFGGEVMKNVAGYDVSRLLCGAYGTLGVLLEVSLKVIPRPVAEAYLSLELSVEQAHTSMVRWQRQSLPLSGLCYDGECLHLRIAGTAKAVEATRQGIGGEPEADGAQFWQRLREQQGPFFEGEGELWRLSVPATTATLALDGRQLVEWGGALRWFRAAPDTDADAVFASADRAGGHAMRFRGRQDGQVFQPLAADLAALHRRVKQSFDPAGIFNPGRMYQDL